MGCDALLGAGDFNRQDSKLCTPWSHRLANVCLQHLVCAGAALSCDEVARSKPFAERALIHHLGSAQAGKMDQLADAYLAAASAHVPHLLSLASGRNRPSSPAKGQLPLPTRRTGAEMAAALAAEFAPLDGAPAEAASSRLFGEGEGGKAAQVVGYLVVLGEACFSVRARLA